MAKKTLMAHFFSTINFWMVERAYRTLNLSKLQFLRKWNEVKKVEEYLQKYITWSNSDDQKIYSFYNGRSAIFHWINLLGIQPWDEILLQAYTCISVPNAIKWTWAKPVYVDIDEETLNIDTKLIERKITHKTKAILIQHTFWNPCDIPSIQRLCKKYRLFLIEDCAHSLGAEYHGNKVGNFWDISIFSFWRDKVISSVNGWFLLINNPTLLTWAEIIEESLKKLPVWLLLKNIFYIPISYYAKKYYDFKLFWDITLGKLIIHLSRKINIIPEVISREEKKCMDRLFYYEYPNSLAYIALSEIEKIDKYNMHRIAVAWVYMNSLWRKNTTRELVEWKNIYLRYPFIIAELSGFKQVMRNKGILVWDWYQDVIQKWSSSSDNWEAHRVMALYENWSCPVAEKMVQHTVNLPNHPWISKEEAEYVCETISYT